MAKVSQVNRNAKRERMAARDKTKRAALKSSVMDRDSAVEERFDASMKLAQTAAQRCRRPGQAALRSHRPVQGKLSQVQGVPHRVAGLGQFRADPRHGQGELVGEPGDVDVRSAG